GDFVILTHQMASVTTKILKEPVNDLSTFRDELMSANDFPVSRM
ncbi:CcdB family protein, partial [Vibrio vulnificus]